MSSCSTIYDTRNCWSFNKKFYIGDNFFTKPSFFKTEIRKLWSRESKAFSILIVTRKPVILNQPLISIMSETDLPSSPITLQIKTFSKKILSYMGLKDVTWELEVGWTFSSNRKTCNIVSIILESCFWLFITEHTIKFSDPFFK